MEEYKEPSETVKEAVTAATRFVNGNHHRDEEFYKLMSNQHRTLQQNFTRLCLKWLEFVASDEYRTDGRNEDSKKVANEMLDGFLDKVAERYPHQPKESFKREQNLPSNYLPYI